VTRETVLIIEDERDIVEVLQYNLEREGFTVLTATDGEKGLDLARERSPSVIVLDLMLPGLDGLAVARRLRSHPATQEASIIVLTAKADESDVVLGLGVGADDYVTKPFRIKELIARIKAVLRRGPILEEGTSGRRLERNGLVIDTSRYQVLLDDRELPFTLTEFKLLAALASAPGRVFTRPLLLEKVQGDAFIDERNIDVHIRSIRKKLGTAADHIVTVRGVGYKFKD
jgi:two-component system phosphate regulon response regulator PhoB